jgi:galactokinase/mevalonate kinase-like predicted kinase
VLPGLNRLYYNGEYWPSEIESVSEDDILRWLEKYLWLVPLYPRYETYNVLANTNITREGARALSDAANKCWEAILNKDIGRFGRSVRESFEAQTAMFPNMISDDIMETLDKYRDTALGWKLSGAGGGGYIILVSEMPVENAIQIRIRRNDVH